MILAILALLITCAAFAVSASGEKAAATIDLSKFNCPCSACGGKPYTGTWITYDDIIGGKSMIDPNNGDHFYINKTLTPGQQISVAAGEEVVYVLDNANVIVGGNTTDGITGRAMLVSGAGAKMHLIGNNGVYTVKSSSTSTGIMQISADGILNLYGKLTIQRNSVGTNASTNSGLFRLYNGNVHIHDCDGMNLPTNDDPVCNAPALANTTDSKGGIVNFETGNGSNSSFVMDAGTLNGTSKAYAGGAISAPCGTVTINGGTINGGTVTDGGAIYVDGGSVAINGGTINGGTATNGGAIYVNSGTVTIGNDPNNTAGVTVNGSVAEKGGAIYLGEMHL